MKPKNKYPCLKNATIRCYEQDWLRIVQAHLDTVAPGMKAKIKYGKGNGWPVWKHTTRLEQN